MSHPEEALESLHEAVDRAGYQAFCAYGLDCAATHFYDADSDLYQLAGQKLTRDDLIDTYESLVAHFGVISLEDPLHEEDFEGFAEVTARTGVQVIGDDLFVTNPERVAVGIEHESANALLWKFNQVGTLSEALDAANLATRHGYRVIVSERSGETEDPVIADLVVGMGAAQIKEGAPVRGERTAKYNRLLAIEHELGSAARYAGRSPIRLDLNPR
jgi:enolase